MKRLLQWLIVAPLAILGVAFAVANRQSVEIFLDPFASGASGQMAVQLPLFLVIVIALAVGVLIGGCFTWLNQGKHRRALREARGELVRLHGGERNKS